MIPMKQPALPAGKVIDVSIYESVGVSVSGIGGGTITFLTAAANGGIMAPQAVIKAADFSTVATVTADGNYIVPGDTAADLKWTYSGSGTPVVDVIAKG